MPLCELIRQLAFSMHTYMNVNLECWNLQARCSTGGGAGGTCVVCATMPTCSAAASTGIIQMCQTIIRVSIIESARSVLATLLVLSAQATTKDYIRAEGDFRNQING